MIDPKRRGRADLLAKVARREITPCEAEAEAQRNGLEPLNSVPNPDEFDPSQISRWSFAMAIAWIGWRNMNLVRTYWDDYRQRVRVWKEYNLPESMWDKTSVIVSKMCLVPLDQPYGTYFELSGDVSRLRAEGHVPVLEPQKAQQVLWAALGDGKLVATGFDVGAGRRVDIPAREFQDLRIYNLPKMPDTLESKFTDGPRYVDASLRRADLTQNWPAPHEQRTGTIAAELACQKWLESLMKLSQEKRPKSRDEFLDEALPRFPDLKKRGFDRAWQAAIKATDAVAWRRSGRPKKSPQ